MTKTQKQKKEILRRSHDQIAEMMKDAYEENVEMDVTPSPLIEERSLPLPKLENLSAPILEKIIKELSNEADYPSVIKGNFPMYGNKKEAMIKAVWKLAGVSSSLYSYFHNLSPRQLRDIPRPKIGLRIMPKPNKNNTEKEHNVILYVYGMPANANRTLCVARENIEDAIYPAIIETDLVIEGFVLNDDVVEMLKGFDTRQAEMVKFNNVRSIELRKYSIPDVVNLFPNAMDISFFGDENVASLTQLTVAGVPDMDVHLQDIPRGSLIAQYNDIDTGTNNRQKRKRNRARLIRAVRTLRADHLVDNNEEKCSRTVCRLWNFLDDPHTKDLREDHMLVQQKLDAVEERIKVLQNRLRD